MSNPVKLSKVIETGLRTRPAKIGSRGGNMPNLSGIVSQLEVQRKQTQQELARLDAAIAALRGLDNPNGARPKPVRSGWKMSAEGRRKISQAKKAWWAKRNRQSSTKPRRTLSLGARRKIAAAQRPRWARVKRAV